MEEEREWICGGCGVLREERVQLEGKVGGEGLGVEEVNIGCLLGNGGADKGLQKRRYFMSLPHAHLVSLLLHASDLTPELPLFAPDARAAAKSSRVGEERPDRAANDEVVDLASPTADELEYEDILPYPKAGNGIPLPPESEDLEFLIDDDVVTFSHTWRDTVIDNMDEPYVNGGFLDGGGQQGRLSLLSVGA